MKRSVLLLYLITISSVIAVAGVFSAQTSVQLAKQVGKSPLRQHAAAISRVKAFVTVDDVNEAINHFAQSGVVVNSRYGNVLAVTLPVGQVDALARSHGVKHIALEQRCYLCNDSALRMSHFPNATYSHGSEESYVYSGRGVVVGVIDVGVDFNHINFLDSAGNSRIVRAYLPCDSTGSHPHVNGMELPGSEYVTIDQIKTLTTDDTKSGHGTHTTGTAAGGYLGNGLNGVATGAQIVVCSMPEEYLTDVNIANSVNYIFNYANEVGLPAVINMSLSSQDGPHDGTSQLCKVFDELSGPGRICVVSASNDGDKAIHIQREMQEDDSLATFLVNSNSNNKIEGYSSMWSSSAEPHSVEMVVWDIVADTLVHRLALPQSPVADSVYCISSDNDAIFGQYFNGEVYFACAIEENGLFHSLIQPDFDCLDSQHYRVGIIYRASQGVTLNGWAGVSLHYSGCSLNDSGWLDGTTVGTISDLATGDSTISVGAYCSSFSFTMKDGSTNTNNEGQAPGAIAIFSSYGPDARGIPRPTVTAPGCALASSQNRYYSVYTRPKYQVDVVEIEGVQYPYGVGWGTSMSAPVVTGAIALMLEIDPTLSPATITDILRATSIRDEWVDMNEERWGVGKLDIYACIKLLLGRMRGDVNGDGVVNSADVTCLYKIILGNGSNHIQRADLNIDGVINSADITVDYSIILGK